MAVETQPRPLGCQIADRTVDDGMQLVDDNLTALQNPMSSFPSAIRLPSDHGRIALGVRSCARTVALDAGA